MPALDEHCLNIYTDGSRKEKPWRGGYAYRFVLVNDETGYEEPLDFSSGCCKGVSNNQMELMACIEALKVALKDPDIYAYLIKSKRIVIYTDSKYIQDNYQYAMYEWSTNDWKRAEGASVENIKLWKELNKLRRRVYRDTSKIITFEKVKAHKKGPEKDPHNDAVDKRAQLSANSKITCKCNLIPPEDVRKKNTNKKTIAGAVKLSGQTLETYIVSDKRIKKGHFGIKYKVVQVDSEYYDLVDYAKSDIPMRAGHYYLATFNDNQKNPLILEAEETDNPTIES